MKSFNKILLILTLISIIGCKKKATPAPDYYMTLKINGKEITYTTCIESEILINGEPRTTISGYYSTASDQTAKMFEITQIADENNLKTGQVYNAQSMNALTLNNDVIFHYYTDIAGQYEGSSSLYNPIGTVTLTEVTPTSIKGTFSALLNNDGTDIGYTVTDGTFYSTHNEHQGVIQE